MKCNILTERALKTTLDCICRGDCKSNYKNGHFSSQPHRRKFILIHHACIAFHLHFRTSSLSQIGAHSQRSLLMGGRFNFFLKVLHLSQTNWVAVEKAETPKRETPKRAVCRKTTHTGPWMEMWLSAYCKNVADVINIIICDASAQSRSIKTGSIIIKASLLLMSINALPREAAKKSQYCNKRYN